MKVVYNNLRKRLSAKQKGKLSKIVLAIRRKPTVKKDYINQNKKFPNREKGGLIISADFEMAWAWRFTKTGADYIKKAQLERKNMPQILKVLESYNIPITFATVGHLFLENCNHGDHSWMKRIPHFDEHWRFTTGDWYDHDPNTDFQVSPEWYAPDLIHAIIDSRVQHEIASHTFSHIDLSDKNCPPSVANDELKACKKAASPFGLQLTSMVFPGGTWGNVKNLQKHGFSIYRKREDSELSYPYRDNYGLLVSTSTGSLEYDLGYGWTTEYFLTRLSRYLDKAIKTNTICHLWFHPSLDPFILEEIFPSFLSYASSLRESGALWIGTMKEISEFINETKVI